MVGPRLGDLRSGARGYMYAREILMMACECYYSIPSYSCRESMCLTRRKALPWTCHSKGVVMLLKSITVHSRVSSCAKSFLRTIRLDQDTARELQTARAGHWISFGFLQLLPYAIEAGVERLRVCDCPVSRRNLLLYAYRSKNTSKQANHSLVHNDSSLSHYNAVEPSKSKVY